MTLHQPETLLAVKHRFMYGLEFCSPPSAIRIKQSRSSFLSNANMGDNLLSGLFTKIHIKLAQISVTFVG
jgi:hypothetical protein